MPSNLGVVYLRPGKVEVQSIDYPELKTPQGKKIDHGVIIKPITTNICGSDQHMVRGRTTAPAGLVLGHEITFRGAIFRKSPEPSTAKIQRRVGPSH
jgi:glutathione-independent formaldehyde dehydrogenase